MQGREDAKKKALVLLTGGGHLFQTLLLVRKMAGRFDFDYAVVGWGGPPSFEGLPPGQVYKVVSLSNFSRNSRLGDLYGLCLAFAQCVRILARSRPDLVLGVGTNNVLPLFLAAWPFRIKRVFVESITRVETPSRTARIVARLGVANRLYVQWPGLVGKLPGAAYKGSVL
ncbi:MAG: hypothetical protein WD100_13010 [Tistlia sp.]|uniref:hypothetical protein n=1 Tax=Tistlia sp. TaxID=3057121 RepID=UPI0034A38C0C